MPRRRMGRGRDEEVTEWTDSNARFLSKVVWFFGLCMCVRGGNTHLHTLQINSRFFFRGNTTSFWDLFGVCIRSILAIELLDRFSRICYWCYVCRAPYIFIFLISKRSEITNYGWTKFLGGKRHYRRLSVQFWYYFCYRSPATFAGVVRFPPPPPKM
jgi:hypothetical protein